MVRGSTRLVVLALASACAKKDDRLASDDYIDDDVPAGSCMSESGEDCDTEPATDGATTAEVAGTCESTMECGAGQTCMATFDGDIGEFECQSSCVADMDETRWCLDDQACCEAGSVCAERGYCRPAEGAADTGADTTGT